MSGNQMTNLLPALDNVIEINNFFKGKNVFITGGTGFMGKVLIEKLLWSCEDIGNVYILLRAKRNKNMEERLQHILNLEVFNRIREKNPKILEKIIPVKGDISELNLGLNNDDTKTLEDKVSVVFHFAATVRFTEPLTKAILMNVRGTREVVNLARNMRNLKALIHVSTMYCNTNKSIIQEKVYTEDSDWRTIIKIAETVDQNTLNSLQDKIKGYQPNTYTYTKYLAENVVNEYREEIPTLIFRPSIVSCSIIDPYPGWVDSLNGNCGMYVGIITGVLHVILGKTSSLNDHIPCDYCANAIIVSACYRGMSKAQESITVNAASGNVKEIHSDYLFDIAYSALDNTPLEKTLWEPVFYTTENRHVYMLLVFLLHILPGIFFDAIFKIAGVKFSLLATYRKIFLLNEIFEYFTKNHWSIETNNWPTLYSYMTPKEKEMFKMDLESINNVEAITNGLIGMKKYILKEDFTEEALARAKTHLKRVRMANFVLKGILLSLVLWMGYHLMNYAVVKLGDMLSYIE